MDYLVKELVISLAVIFGTIAVTFLIGLIAKRFVKPTNALRAELKIYFDRDNECFEAAIERLMKTQAIRELRADVIVVDTEKSEESRKWLASLQKKLGYSFYIIEQ